MTVQPRQVKLGAFLHPTAITSPRGATRAPMPTPASTSRTTSRLAQHGRARPVRHAVPGRQCGRCGRPRRGAEPQPALVALRAAHPALGARAVTEHIGLVATASTTYNEPFHLARKFASLDHISGGRAGWNLVTSAHTGRGLQLRPRRAPDARRPLRPGRANSPRWCRAVGQLGRRRLPRATRQSGRLFDPDKLHVLDHKGEHFQVRGPLNVARSPQGHPVMVQAGSSEDGQDFAAEIAEVIFTAQQRSAERRAFYARRQGPGGRATAATRTTSRSCRACARRRPRRGGGARTSTTSCRT